MEKKGECGYESMDKKSKKPVGKMGKKEKPAAEKEHMREVPKKEEEIAMYDKKPKGIPSKGSFGGLSDLFPQSEKKPVKPKPEKEKEKQPHKRGK